MKKFPGAICLILFSAGMISCSPGRENQTEKPNIILICADDMGWSDLGCYGSEVQTPNLDKLAENGLRFTQFHNTSKCFPSRACLLTGVYAQDCGYSKTFTNPIQNAVTLGEVLQQAGYMTFWSGKHHGKENPYDRGFDHYFGLKDGACNFFNPGMQREGEAPPAHKSAVREWCIDSLFYKPYTPPEKDFYTTDYFTHYALKYIDEAVQKARPFFLYLAFNAPHDPLMAWPEDIGKYRGKYDAGYEAIRRARYQKQLDIGLIDDSYRLSEPTFDEWEDLSEADKLFEAAKMEVYAAMIDRMDQNIGRVLKKLKDSNLSGNTIILFVSDNGASAEMVNLRNDNDNAPVGSIDRWVSLGGNWANVGNTPFRFYKNYSYEGGINTPLIVYWPGEVAPGTISRYPGHFIDFMPTFMELAGAEYPETFNGQEITPFRGQSLVPAFRGEDVERSGPLYWEWARGAALRLDEWKIVRYGAGLDWDLYDVQKDPTELDNLAADFPEKVRELDSLYQLWINQTRD